MHTTDVIVLGGGLVGSAIAYGLARLQTSVIQLDEGDIALRASRGNFGLVWVQGKGLGYAQYARWSLQSSKLWPQLQQSLLEETGVDVQLNQRGGYHICLTEEEVAVRRERLQWLQDQVGADLYPFQILAPEDAREDLPGLGPAVAGVSYTPMDGHCNPLKLFHALHTANQRRGVQYRPNTPAVTIQWRNGMFTVQAPNGEQFQAPKLVVAAGLANQSLSAEVGMHVPVRPNKGQVLITERLAPQLRCASNYVRQTDEGSIQIGDSMEEAGYDDTVRVPVSAEIAARAVACFPALRNVRIVRSWAALRIMTPDGFPIYQESEECPGAYVATCHSGVTLAAQHALTVAPWIRDGVAPELLGAFPATRFNPETKITHYGR